MKVKIPKQVIMIGKYIKTLKLNACTLSNFFWYVNQNQFNPKVLNINMLHIIKYCMTK